MSFMTVKFVLFLAALVVLLRIQKQNRTRQITLLIASYVFYLLNDARFLLLLFAVSVLSWILGIKMEQTGNHRKVYLIAGVSVDLFVLGIFKYFNFFSGSFCNLFGVEVNPISIVLPLGISFYIFQAISYLADVYSRKIKAEASAVKVLLYIGFFPQIVSGPIVKAHDFMSQLEEQHGITWGRISCGAQRFVLGAFKKLVMADRLGVCVDAVYSVPAAYSGFSLIMAVFSYALQIYYDFSGYSDMAIGVAWILGFDLGKNFNLPYMARNPSDFWRRWHISLSSWFRDYVYIPLGGSRKKKYWTYLNLCATMLLSGLWHGANWAFIIWGGSHAVISVIHRVFADRREAGAGFGRLSSNKNSNKNCSQSNNIYWQTQTFAKLPDSRAKGIMNRWQIWPLVSINSGKAFDILARILTFIVISVLWIPFRVNDVETVTVIICRILTWSTGIHYVYTFSVIFGIFLICVEAVAGIVNKGDDIWKPLDLSRFLGKVVFISFVFMIIVFSYFGNSAFIYAQF